MFNLAVSCGLWMHRASYFCKTSIYQKLILVCEEFQPLFLCFFVMFNIEGYWTGPAITFGVEIEKQALYLKHMHVR